MTDEHRPPAPWERPLSKIRDEKPGDTPASEPNDTTSPRSRRRGTGGSERLTVAELRQRAGQSTPAAASPPEPPVLEAASKTPWLNQGVVDRAAHEPQQPVKANPQKVPGTDVLPPRSGLPTHKRVQRAGMAAVALVSVLAVALTGLVWAICGSPTASTPRSPRWTRTLKTCATRAGSMATQTT